MTRRMFLAPTFDLLTSVKAVKLCRLKVISALLILTSHEQDRYALLDGDKKQKC